MWIFPFPWIGLARLRRWGCVRRLSLMARRRSVNLLLHPGDGGRDARLSVGDNRGTLVGEFRRKFVQ